MPNTATKTYHEYIPIKQETSMKRLLSIIVMTVIIGGGTWPVFAETVPVSMNGHDLPLSVTVHDATVIPEQHDKTIIPYESAIRTTSGAKFTAPSLIEFTENLTMGIEVGKELAYDLFQDSEVFTEDDKGYFGFITVTYTGTLFSFKK